MVAFRLSHARLANQLLVGCEHANVAAATAREMSAASRQTRYTNRREPVDLQAVIAPSDPSAI